MRIHMMDRFVLFFYFLSSISTINVIDEMNSRLLMVILVWFHDIETFPAFMTVWAIPSQCCVRFPSLLTKTSCWKRRIASIPRRHKCYEMPL